jgi:hypothetical protein
MIQILLQKIIVAVMQFFIREFWLSVATVELILIVLLLYKARPKKTKIVTTPEPQQNQLVDNNLFQACKETKIDMGNVIDSINKSRDLYKILSAKCHPDRFIDKELNRKADIIFQDITRNQRNYKNLLQLKEIAQTQLNITIKN